MHLEGLDHFLNRGVLIVTFLAISAPVGAHLARKLARGRQWQRGARHRVEDQPMEVLVLVLATKVLLHLAPVVLDSIARKLAVSLG